ncbi:hypothetical protein MPK67_gp079 [Erwinia phage pEa_SNUABM_32]|uniref:Uncharacterized protein n=2 Tax=Alexandravirus TaxID=2733088 RepID=A0AAE8BZX9_9CAUD|nr:hypothetical protein MPK67_gp079 [Erwinia phage pEa_SNUABM_32]YP_010301192.1 hypothetical protein MPK68_gp079 [Erwinia phage pEa_SNUABM_3]QZE58295.1 hypothetical protein pEaSNUABM40_00079 [Erwinia phage pEa_SNUABM_40]UAW52860.1 hypothetical protein pEaSNUABM23_00078 [Erwinia phage pEa_SNUABM_23]UIW10756.1 hypothetical protein pEaSNUABM23_00078 [Erwinia phage pEa_SNUABM_31]QZE56276.1 hypothetical protein pEaSNUABM3_00079 [Erwinia phage pEa_SNUABM_3]QZE56952.1 hypothetical protein pEaSNUABM3
MKMLPSTANAMMRNAFSSLVSAAIPTNYTTVANSILFYTGTMPTKAEVQALLAEATQLAGGNALYTRISPLLNAHAADYVGGVAGNKAAMTLNANNVPVLLASAMNMKAAAGNTDYRSSYFLKDATPTWCIVACAYSNTLNLQTGTNDAGCAFLAICSVGDENSNADLRLKGGKVYANSSTPTDQSKAVIINDLVLKFV